MTYIKYNVYITVFFVKSSKMGNLGPDKDIHRKKNRVAISILHLFSYLHFGHLRVSLMGVVCS